MNQKDPEVSRLAQEASAFFKQSVPLYEEAGRYSKEAARLYTESGNESRRKNRTEAKRLMAAGDELMA